MDNAIGQRPSKLGVLRTNDALRKEPVDHVQDDCTNVGEYVSSHCETHVVWMASPGYP